MSLSLDKSTWKRVAFGDVVDNVNETVRDGEAAGIDRIIAMEHMDPGELKIRRWGATEAGTTFTRQVRPGQTLFGKRRAYQRKVAYAEFDAICSGDIYTFEAEETQLLGEFLPFIVQSNEFFDHALDTSAGSLSPRTNWRDLANFEFDLPPLDEQKRIANLLWAVEGTAGAHASLRAATADARTVWCDGRVLDLVEVNAVPFSKLWARSPESGWSSVPVDEVTGYYVLSLAALGPAGYRLGHLKNVADSDKVKAAVLSHGDLLISRANTVNAVGRAGIYVEELACVSFPDTMMRVSMNEDVLVEFAAAVITSAHGRAHMRRSAAGSATSMVKINRASLGRLKFPVVSIDAQREFLAQLHRLDTGVASLDAAMVAVADLRSSLSAEIFGGE